MEDTPEQRAKYEALRDYNRRSFELEEMRQFSKAATNGQGTRKERRRMQAELKKMMRKR
ncbi:hypothetical protein [Mesorhizobium sp. B2-4-5]|uniref:hypothetical protein n=1 Tax=Mesorhizobium sp. B2-4-5 TaxID=2589944 RepID=UPI0015E3C3C7|nr:hypothetical protein [Mesorhizobium sp. B2-4-5]